VMLASRGARVLIFGRHQPELDDALKEIKSAGGEGFGVVADQSRQSDIRKIFQEADRRLGGVDILINNAAVSPDSVLEGDYEDWQYALNTNLLGYIACCREALDRMKDKGSGHIVNVGSMSADLREPGGDVYVATKAGIQGFSESLRKKVNEMGIRLTLIEPGLVDSELSPKPEAKKREKKQNQEMLEAQDIAESIFYVISQPPRCDVVQLQIRPLKQLI
jgi:NADP-dependent 3-hydroxy acid dehydrogenase YdfG